MKTLSAECTILVKVLSAECMTHIYVHTYIHIQSATDTTILYILRRCGSRSGSPQLFGLIGGL